MPQDWYLTDIQAGLGAQGFIVTHNHELFWNSSQEYEIVHLHWPEYLSYQIESCLSSGLTEDLIRATAERLDYWRNHSRLVVTRHNIQPHGNDSAAFSRLYEEVYRRCHAVIHMSRWSQEDYLKRYRSAFDTESQLHSIIPHPIYAHLPSTISRNQARRRLNIPYDANVLCVFGSITSDRERELILAAFHNLRLPRKILLIPHWREKLRNIKWIRLKYWLRDLDRLYYRLYPNYRFGYSRVEDIAVQVHMNAADIIFIPRIAPLNSGVLVLAMTFGRIVVGANTGSVGEILHDFRNPTFNPADLESVVAAISSGFAKSASGLGEINRQRATTEWSVESVITKHVELFTRVVHQASCSSD
jgi:glycosyltransferase involved in cell wall biosynthesis